MIHAIIPAGGAGTRLWPLSRRSHPKFLLPLNHPRQSLLQQTVARLQPLCESVTIVTGEAHAEAVRAQLDSAAYVIAEPSPRNSMPAIGLAAALIGRRWGEDAVIGSFAADHAIRDEQRWRECIGAAQTLAAGGDYLVTLGITPTYPATGYGYIHPAGEGGEVTPGGTDTGAADGATRAATEASNLDPAPVKWWPASEFVEKPPVAMASRMVAEGYLWNAGVFVARAGTILGALERLYPHFADTLEELAQNWEQLPPSQRLELFSSLPANAIDHALAEPLAAAGKVRTVAVETTVGWADLGDFTALAGRPHPYQRRAIEVGAQRSLAVGQSGAKPVVVVGIDDCIVVETEDALLVTTAAHAQQVAQVGEILSESGLGKLR